MKIAYVITRSDEVGGAHIHVRDLADWARSRGHDVKVFVGGNGIFCEKLTELNIPFHSLGNMQRSISPFRDAISVFELKNALQSYSPDIVSIHSAKAGLVGRLACFYLKAPCIFTAHGWSFARGKNGLKRKLFLLIEKVLSILSKRIITVCNDDSNFAIEQGICKPSRIRIIYNGMPQIPESFVSKTDRDQPVITMVARFEYPKNHRQLIDALSQIQDLPWKLNLVGDGPNTDEIREYSQQKGILDRINFMGRRWDIPEILFNSDIFVLTTYWEGFPRSIIEALRAGLPVVASNVAGIPEAVVDNETGFLVPVEETNILTEKLKILILDRKIRKMYGNKGRERYSKLFNFEITASKTIQLYEDILIEHRKLISK